MFLNKLDDSVLPAPSGNYNYGVKIGDFVYLSMMLPKDENDKIDDDITEQCVQVMENIKQLLYTNNLAMHHIVKTTIYVSDKEVIPTINDIYGKYFDDKFTLPARSLVVVNDLPLNAKVAIDGLVIDTLALEQQANESSCDGHCGGCSGCE